MDSPGDVPEALQPYDPNINNFASQLARKRQACEADKVRAAQLVARTACASSGLCDVLFLN